MPENKGLSSGSKTKETIIKCARELFSLYGYKGTSVRKLAAQVGVRESALYNHFKNKEDIFLAVSESIFSAHYPRSLESDITEKAKGGKSFLSRFVTDYKLVTFDKHNESLFRILMLELLQNRSLRKSFKEQYHDKNNKLLSQAFFIMMQDDLIKSSDPMLLANEFMAPLFYLRLQVTLLRLDGESTNALATQFEKHVEFFWDSIRNS